MEGDNGVWRNGDKELKERIIPGEVTPKDDISSGEKI